MEIEFLKFHFTVFSQNEFSGRTVYQSMVRLKTQVICYARHYLFEKDRLKVSVQLKSKTGESSVVRLFENIPLTTCTYKVSGDETAICKCDQSDGSKLNVKSLGATIRDSGFGNPLEGSYNMKVLGVYNDSGIGVDIVFDKTRQLTIKPHGVRRTYYYWQLQVGRVEVELPSTIHAGEIVQLSYELIPNK